MVKPHRSAGYFLDSFGSLFLIMLTPAFVVGDAVSLSIGTLGILLAALWWGPNMTITDEHVVTRHYFRPVRRRVPIRDIASVHATIDPKERWEGTGRGARGVTLVLKSGERVAVVESASFSREPIQRWQRYLSSQLEVPATE